MKSEREKFKEWLKTKNVEALFDLLENAQTGKTNSDPDKINCIIEELHSRELSEIEIKIFERLMNHFTNDNSNESGRYSFLKTIIGLISVLGYLVIIIGIGFLIIAHNTNETMIGILGLIISIVISLPLLAFANLIHVLIDIEYNTRKTRDIIEIERRKKD